MKFKVIGIAGNARVGKDTAANYIQSKFADYQILSFAAPIKMMLIEGFNLSDDQLWGDKKDVMDERYGCTPRHMMQTLGTEWGRNLIGNDIWVNAVKQNIKISGSPTIVPDVRFESEADMIRDQGILIHIIGRDKIKSSHSSETGIYFKEGDIQISNNSSLKEFYAKLEKLVNKKLT